MRVTARIHHYLHQGGYVCLLCVAMQRRTISRQNNNVLLKIGALYWLIQSIKYKIDFIMKVQKEPDKVVFTLISTKDSILYYY